MNTIFHSDTNETGASLNPNNIIIVSDNESGWSREYDTTNKKILPLRIVNNVMGNTMESNSNDTENEGDPLNTLVSEDSSEWSQNFIAVNENQSSLSDIHDANSMLMERNKEFEENKEQVANKNCVASENSNELNSPLPDPGDIQDVTMKKPTGESVEEDLLRCRTCLCIPEPKESNPLFTLDPSGETLKELLIYLIPQMATTLCDEDVICNQCENSIKFCVDFIDNCVKVETELLNDSEDQNAEDPETEGEATLVTLDHDYMVLPQVKIEEDSMETEEPQITECFLSNDDPTLASAEEYLFECFRCGMTFESEKALDNHTRVQHGALKDLKNGSTHEEERIYYKCKSCEVLFATNSAYNSHVQTSHPEIGTQAAKQGTYTCKQCGKMFFYLGDLFEHKRTIHGFLCTVCPERFNTKEELATHMETHPDLYYCEICNKGFKTRKTLTNHVKLHDNPRLNTCPGCSTVFNSSEELIEHMEQSPRCISNPMNVFPCDLCSSTFTEQRRLRRHKQVYHSHFREYLCTICDKNFSSKTSLDSHCRLKHAEVKPYQCELCGERFARLDYLRRHTNCDKSTPCKKFMKGPRRKFRYTKADGEPIKCKLCGKVFKDVYLLKLHLTTHTNLRRFRCSVCNLTFTTNKNRERHEKIHDDPLSKYRCTVCWKRTQSQVELDSHMLSHEKKYQCHVCQESFARVYLLNYHVSEVHADDEDVEKEKQIVFTEGLKEYLVEY